MNVFNLVVFILLLLSACWKASDIFISLMKKKSIVKDCAWFTVYVVMATIFYIQLIS